MKSVHFVSLFHRDVAGDGADCFDFDARRAQSHDQRDGVIECCVCVDDNWSAMVHLSQYIHHNWLRRLHTLRDPSSDRDS
jgi:hypothetical protein